MSRRKNRKKIYSGISGISSSIKNGGVGRKVQSATNETIVPDQFRGNRISFYEIPVIRKQQKDVVYYSGEMSISELAALTSVSNYDGSKDGDTIGYQRNHTEKRGREFGYRKSLRKPHCLRWG